MSLYGNLGTAPSIRRRTRHALGPAPIQVLQTVAIALLLATSITGGACDPNVEYVVDASPDSIVAGDSVTCDWELMHADDSADLAGVFVGLFAIPAPANFWIGFEFLPPDQSNGTWTHATSRDLTPGTYQCRVQQTVLRGAHTNVSVLAVSETNVTATAPTDLPPLDVNVQLDADGEVLTAGEYVNCSWAASSPAVPGDFIGLFPTDGDVCSWMLFDMLPPGSSTGSWAGQIPANLQPGEYTCRVVHRTLGTGQFVLRGESEPFPVATGALYFVEARDQNVTAGDKVRCDWTAVPGSVPRAFVGLYKWRAPIDAFLASKKIEVGKTKGVAEFSTSIKKTPPGLYECRVMMYAVRSLLTVQATTPAFTISK